MPFETIDNMKPVASQVAVSADGVRVQAKTLARKDKDGVTRFIKVTVGAALARKLVWRDDKVRIDLGFGTGRDAGKIRAAVNLSGGQFVASKTQKGCYTFTINAASADGLFALEFPDFDIPAIEPVHAAGSPPALVFADSPAMLAGD